MRTLVVAACLLLSLPALAAAPDAAPAPAAAAAPIDWALQADHALTAVKPQLQLSDAQVAQIRPLLIHYLPKLRDLFDSYAGHGVESGSALITHFREAREAFKHNLDPILNDAQKQQFLVLRHEVDGEIRKEFIAARLGWYRRTLGLDDAQIEKIRPIVTDHFDKQLEILTMHADSPSGPAAAAPMGPQLQMAQQATDDRLRGVLTPQQMETYLAAENKKAGGS
jgi:Spy/CpxP family protein refolding chaperone